ncbi:glycosyltransferase family 61 protein [Ketogulonicigenium vulgare]|uniref:glycosyltransferase family 61 protein n=1 Tax=Ketogulonicigenium vulgare TaxID=92945 RepID=UPI00235A4658|nr:glycosyltransferase family 61 protein [Ketogulonicigenium vulgare]
MTFPPPISAATPQDFFRPGVDEGLWLLRPESMEPVPFEMTDIPWLSLASDHRIRLLNDSLMRTYSNNGSSLLFPSVLAYAQDVTVSQTYMAIGGKYLLSAAGGRRIRSSFIQTRDDAVKGNKDLALARHLEDGARKARPLTIWDGPDPRDLDFVIDTRNFHNFYHFTKESLPLLTLYAQYGLRGRIVFYANNENISDFVHQSIEAWFPELRERIVLTGSNKQKRGYNAKAALIAYDTTSYYFQTTNRLMRDVNKLGVKIDRRAKLSNARDLAKITVEAPLAALRARALQRVDHGQVPKLRLYVQRRAARNRAVVNESLLTDILSRHGFHMIAFEDSIVPEQAAIVANCEALVSIHGAGVTNMLYAPSGAKIFELSNTQTINGRFGDFSPIANAAAVTYAHIYLDHDHPDPSYVPSIANDSHRGVRFTPFSASATAAYIFAMLDKQDALDAHKVCETANSEGNYDLLVQLLDQHQDIMAHTADYHVWRANIASQQHNRPEVLRNLIHALMLAPRRIMLLKRILPIAAELSDTSTFDFAAQQMHRIDEALFIDFFKKNDWAHPDSITIKVEEAPDEDDALPDMGGRD